MTHSPKLSIVIPCFNESKNISIVLGKFDKILKEKDYNAEIIIVDGGSTDETSKILKRDFQILDPQKFKLILMSQPGGYGYDIMKGLSQSCGDIMSWTHADLQTDPYDVIRAFNFYLEKTKNNEKIFIKGKRKNRRLSEVFFTFGMQIVAWLILRKRLDDINAQPKLFARSFYNNYLKENPPSDFSLDLYALYQAKTNGYTIMNIPVYFAKRIYGEAKGGGGGWRNRIRLIKRTFKYILKLKRNTNSLS